MIFLSAAYLQITSKRMFLRYFQLLIVDKNMLKCNELY